MLPVYIDLISVSYTFKMLGLYLVPLFALVISVVHSQDAPDYTSALNFQLKIYTKTISDLNPSVNNYVLNYNHKTRFTILSPRKRTVPETSYYVNGTYFEHFHGTATLWTEDSSHAINISSDDDRDEKGRRTVYFSKHGQQGVGVRPYPGAIPDLYYGSSTFYACKVAGLGVQLFYRDTVTYPSLIQVVKFTETL
jgi:hypothetical protein